MSPQADSKFCLDHDGRSWERSYCFGVDEAVSEVIEFFYPGGFAHDYEFTARSSGIVHLGRFVRVVPHLFLSPL
jgi:hypothetical protein